MTKFVVTHNQYSNLEIVRHWTTAETAALDVFMSLRDRLDLDVYVNNEKVRTYRHWKPDDKTRVFDGLGDLVKRIDGDYGALVKDIEDFVRTLEA